ncbi:origin recognition complex subunit 3 N-terminus-domain-containing protein [Syncephalastrum racemosum]|uniref:Origin recognition complex subunit 3 N-terminus-domain-containing protein n=1 Tax=Syncephalastrum racemosum TaxID=13706 RepID=A0A1X2HNZ7_SYNRA|nr:origin recognition complex subunit 3 N-terminus-domain-containing protein [Syncephalastrum racemosum]
MLTEIEHDPFHSISEGCFLVLPQKRQNSRSQGTRKRKRSEKKAEALLKRPNDSSDLNTKGFQQLFDADESPDLVMLREMGFRSAWTRLDTLINDVLYDMNRMILLDIGKFVDSAHEKEASSDGLISLPYHEIPTALVFAGINTPDHDTQFSHIARSLVEPPSSETGRSSENYVALLQSKDCSNIRIMMKNMLEQFLAFGDDHTQSDHEDDEMDVDDELRIMPEKPKKPQAYKLGTTTTLKAARLANYDMQIIEGWYEHVSRKRLQKPNLIVILQDLESFDSHVLQDFITICSDYRSRIPITFIIGIATSSEIMHQSLSKSTISLLRIEKFWLEQSDVWFNRVLEKIFIESSDTLKFGLRPYKFLLDHFYLFDFSMNKVTASLKYALMHHYYANPLSIFSPCLQSTLDENRLTLQEWHAAGLLHHHVTVLRMQPSFRKHVDQLVESEPETALKLLQDDAYLLTEAMPHFLVGLKQYQREFEYGLALLDCLHPHLPPNTTKRKTKRMLLLASLESSEGLHADALVTLPAKAIRSLEPHALEALFDDVRALASSTRYASVTGDTVTRLETWRKRLRALVEEDAASSERLRKKLKELGGLDLANVSQTSKRQTETTIKAQASALDHLKQIGEEKTKVAMEVSDWLLETFRHCLRSYTKVPLSELNYYTTAKLHEKCFAAQPRATIQTGLSQPWHYLSCECCAGDLHQQQGASIQPTTQDSCILYKLYLECGRMINLYDWFVAFGCIIEREKRPKGRCLEENEVQARFVRSVAELQYMGFIRPTQRKTDHVLRLSWTNV